MHPTLLISLCFISLHFSTIQGSITANSSTIISSPRTTSWGEWGKWSNCKTREYVYGFQLKTERNRGDEDDTGITGIRLYCAKYAEIRVYSHMLESASGSSGTWGTRYACPGIHFATGFELRSEGGQGGGPLGGDDTGANNLQLVCSRGLSETTLTGDGTQWGSWTGRQSCPVGTWICGLRTQVENPTYEGEDDSGLNNVDMKCCPAIKTL